jgi:hypothetical protein
MRKNIMKKFGCILLFASLLLLFGTVGSMERGYTDFADGTMRGIIYIATMLIGARIINKCEEKRK